ncbi:class F sortase [Cohnella sp. WQ 127256]|uniref:class F sortase n=1 Tax=Cohnella sp. WQ 127256 TaxID=2938790 RepID=UPI002119704A|nr:class F sortase [Cohnella sp. WQ 127256]
MMFLSSFSLLLMKKSLLLVITIMFLISATNCSNSSKIAQKAPPEVLKKAEKVIITPAVPPIYPVVEKKYSVDGIIPSRLFIPTIGVHAGIEPVDVSSTGQMGVPKSTDKVGYLSSGILPGAVGNAVMDGHVDTYNGKAIFYHLKNLKKGDPVFIKNDKERSIEFIVESIEIFKTSEAPINRIFGPMNEPRLNLITCAGKYSRSKREHEARLVVFTRRVSP